MECAIAITGSSYIGIERVSLTGARDEITLKYALQEKDNRQVSDRSDGQSLRSLEVKSVECR
jgi:hypothetical protein